MKWIIQIPQSELSFEFTRSAGPGGQHVNKTNSATILRWNLNCTLAFSEDQRNRLQAKLKSKITQAGEIIIRSQESRDQEKNKKACLQKLNELIDRALFVPKKRKPTKPSKVQKEKRIKEKNIRSQIKKQRTKKYWNE